MCRWHILNVLIVTIVKHGNSKGVFMKNFTKLAGIIVFVSVIGFSIVVCGEPVPATTDGN
jgi:hypothetical protein